MSELLRRLQQHHLPDNYRVPLHCVGVLTRVVGLTLEAVGLRVSLGSRCLVIGSHGTRIEAEVVGFDDQRFFLMPVGGVDGIEAGAQVIPLPGGNQIKVGAQLVGRVINGAGEPLDGRGPLLCDEQIPYQAPMINPLSRRAISEPLDVGIRAINALMTVGKGQRLGLFAGSGVGKSMLLGMMTKFTEADLVVVGLVGERGREVREFIDHILGEEGLRRSVVIAAPADEAALMRLRAAMLATRVAEYYRDQGLNVLLLMDSLTRYAQAQREIALSVGEPPATKGYPPSVFAKLPALVERAGNGSAGSGSITAFYTVLTEGDDLQDPVADSARAILDGHIVLSRRLADQGHYPAIDIEASVSRAMPNIVSTPRLQAAQLLKQIYSRYRQAEDLIQIGAYQKGSDPLVDFALQNQATLLAFLRQGLTEKADLASSELGLSQLLALANKQANDGRG